MKNNCCSEVKAPLNKSIDGARLRFGFTLIEILVVVLIIGILGAIMLPQYQRAVLKSRFASLMPITKSMADSNEAYYLEHGEYADNAQDLPVQGRANYPDGTELEFGTSSDYSYVLATNESGTPNNAYVAYQKHSKNFPDNIHCEAADDDELATWLCRDALHGTPVNTGDIKSLSGEGYTAYVLSGSTSGSTFDRTCEGEAETITQPCPGGCGIMSATPTCNPYTGEWEAQDFDPSTCPTQPEPEVASCSSGDGTKTRTASCNSDGTAYEWGAWDESACCTGNPPTWGAPSQTEYCTGQATGANPVCVNGQWQWTSFSSDLFCSTIGTGYRSGGCTATRDGAANGGPCTGTYQSGSSHATCDAVSKYGCANSTFKALYYTSYAHCIVRAEYACAGSTFEAANDGLASCDVSSGYKNKEYGCANSTFIGSTSSCGSGVGYANLCNGSTFKSGAHCHAKATGSCDNTTYDGNSYCAGGYCPIGTPSQSGWNGNCCNPAYMVSGECPSGVTVCAN